jgi:hypothetical protein
VIRIAEDLALALFKTNGSMRSARKVLCIVIVVSSHPKLRCTSRTVITDNSIHNSNAHGSFTWFRLISTYFLLEAQNFNILKKYIDLNLCILHQ